MDVYVYISLYIYVGVCACVHVRMCACGCSVAARRAGRMGHALVGAGLDPTRPRSAPAGPGGDARLRRQCVVRRRARHVRHRAGLPRAPAAARPRLAQIQGGGGRRPRHAAGQVLWRGLGARRPCPRPRTRLRPAYPRPHTSGRWFSRPAPRGRLRLRGGAQAAVPSARCLQLRVKFPARVAGGHWDGESSRGEPHPRHRKRACPRHGLGGPGRFDCYWRRSELNQGVRTDQYPELDQGVRTDQGARTDQGPSSTEACAPTKVRARPRRTDQGPSSTIHIYLCISIDIWKSWLCRRQCAAGGLCPRCPGVGRCLSGGYISSSSAAVCRWGLCPRCPDVGRCLSGVYISSPSAAVCR